MTKNLSFKKNLFILSCIMLAVFGIVTAGYSQEEKQIDRSQAVFQQINNFKKATVFLGEITEKNGKTEINFIGTGTLLYIQDIFHLVTAKHIVENIKPGTDIKFFLNTKAGGIKYISINEIRKKLNIDWVFHENKLVDIAMIPVLLNPAEDDFTFILESDFESTQNIFELSDLFYLSFQPGIFSPKRINPIIRDGMVSIINEDKTFYIDGFAFPGNSGSPCFLKFSPLFYDKNGPVFFTPDTNNGFKFLGIIGESLTSIDVAVSAQTGRQRVTFEDNTGLSKVWSTDFIREIINSSSFKKQIEKCKNIIKDRK